MIHDVSREPSTPWKHDQLTSILQVVPIISSIDGAPVIVGIAGMVVNELIPVAFEGILPMAVENAIGGMSAGIVPVASITRD